MIKHNIGGAISDNGRVFTNTGIKILKLSTETEREKKHATDFMTSTPCLQIQCYTRFLNNKNLKL